MKPNKPLTATVESGMSVYLQYRHNLPVPTIEGWVVSGKNRSCSMKVVKVVTYSIRCAILDSVRKKESPDLSTVTGNEQF